MAVTERKVLRTAMNPNASPTIALLEEGRGGRVEFFNAYDTEVEDEFTVDLHAYAEIN